MKYKLYLILALVILLSACKASKELTVDSIVEETMDETPVYFEALDLSEDLSILSTGNDELLLMFFTPDDSAGVHLLYSQYLPIDSTPFRWEIQYYPVLSYRSKLLVVLIEIDTSKEIHELVQVVAQNYSAIYQAHTNQDIPALNVFMGDDDLFYIGPLNADGYNSELIIEGFDVFDSYKYHIRY